MKLLKGKLEISKTVSSNKIASNLVNLAPNLIEQIFSEDCDVLE